MTQGGGDFLGKHGAKGHENTFSGYCSAVEKTGAYLGCVLHAIRFK